LEARIILEYENKRTAQAIANAVSPDNFKTPQGLIIKTLRKASKVLTEIQAQTRMTTFIATIDDLLSSASTAEKALQVLEKNTKER
jgi:Transcription factor Pcc1